jgi:hypothetical protein
MLNKTDWVAMLNEMQRYTLLINHKIIPAPLPTVIKCHELPQVQVVCQEWWKTLHRTNQDLEQENDCACGNQFSKHHPSITVAWQVQRYEDGCVSISVRT